MAEALTVVAAVLLVWGVAAIAVLLVLRRRWRRQNRVAASCPSPVPVRWLWSPATGARLHRRLQAAVYPIDPARPDALPGAVGTDELRHDLTTYAVAVDRALAADRGAPRRIRRRQLRARSSEVAVLEDLTARLIGSASPRPPRALPCPSPELAELRARVHALQHGRECVDEIERAVAGEPFSRAGATSTR
jgi:hypothetical protein